MEGGVVAACICDGGEGLAAAAGGCDRGRVRRRRLASAIVGRGRPRQLVVARICNGGEGPAAAAMEERGRSWRPAAAAAGGAIEERAAAKTGARGKKEI
jgi:hypothetical protein